MLAKDDNCFACKCCGEFPPDGMAPSIIQVLNKMGIGADEINSAYRCPSHNAEVGGVPNSFHVQGCAVDVDASVRGVDDLADLAEQCGADGIGKYFDDCFVHCDTRGEYARW